MRLPRIDPPPHCRKCLEDLTSENESQGAPGYCKFCVSGYATVNIRQRMLNSAQKRAENAGVPFTITENDIRIPIYCPILGVKLRAHKGKGAKDDSASLDRIIPELGYVPGNIAVMSHRANRIKSDGTADEHQKIADWIRDNSPVC